MIAYRRTASSTPCGFTLVEVLVALAVISVLAGIALPTLKNSLREQKVTRAATLLQSAIEEGRARSIGRGGGGGIIIDRLGSANLLERSQSIRFRLAQAPPPYSGDTPKSAARFRVFVNDQYPANDSFFLLFDSSQVQMIRSAKDVANGVPTLINVGDAIFLGDARFPMRISSIASAGTQAITSWGLSPTPSLPGPLLPNTYTLVQVVPEEHNVDLRRMHFVDLKFSIQKQPRPAIALPVELPRGTVIDLTASGLGRFGNQFSPMAITGNYVNTSIAPFVDETDPPPVPNSFDYRSIWIIFGARGEVSRVYYSSNSSGLPIVVEHPVIGDIHLLVGHAGELKVTPEGQLEDDYANLTADPIADEKRDGTTPLLDSRSIWVTIKARTGDVLASNWNDPTDAQRPLVNRLSAAPPPTPTIASNILQRDRVQDVIRRVRSSAVQARDGGSL